MEGEPRKAPKARTGSKKDPSVIRDRRVLSLLRKADLTEGTLAIYGVQLPEEVLAKIYFKNALTLLPQMQEPYDTFDGN